MTTGAKGSISIDSERCKGCLLCAEFCPKKLITLSTNLNQKGYFIAEMNSADGCTGCATCALICPDVAIEVSKS